jgi:hypothetical protein
MARDAIGEKKMTVLADRGYFKGEEILQCAQEGITPLVPKPLTSNSKAEGRFDKRDFIYIAKRDEYRCPAGERAVWRMTMVERGMTPVPVLAVSMSALPVEETVHAQRLSPHYALGARACVRSDAAALGPNATSVTRAPTDRRASVRNAQGMDGIDTLPDQDLATGAGRDEPACVGSQLEAGDEDLRNAGLDRVHKGSESA